MRRIVFLTLLLLILPSPTWGQITPPYTFSANTTILSSQVNANFNKFADALNRTGGTITGNIAVDANITIDGVDISDFLTSTQVLTQVVGSVGTPSYSVIGDVDTGFYFPAADQVGVTIAGTGELTLTATALTLPTNNLVLTAGSLTVGAVTNASVPANLIAFTSAGTCPTGWSEYTSARGRYVVGLVSGGTNAATVGTALSNTENRPVGQHNHGVTDPGHFHSYNTGTAAGSTGQWSPSTYDTTGTTATDTKTTGLTVNNEGTTAGTNAPYIQLMACKKD